MVVMTDPDLSKKVKKTCERISENLYTVANEPSLACYRICEHLYKNGPGIQERRFEMKRLEAQLKGSCYDLDYTVGAIQAIQRTLPTFGRIKDLLVSAQFFKQQIDYDSNVRLRVAQKAKEDLS